MEELKKCPFCGCNLIAIGHNKHSVYGICVNCDAQGPPADTESEAREEWARREPGKE